MDNLSLLNDLVQDIGCLAPITEALNKVNFFKVLELERKEIRHSNMLKWLLDPHENHGLGDRVLRRFFRLVTPDLPSDYSSFRAEREVQWIDLLVYSKKEKYVICLENKMDTGEHDDQLSRYKRYVEDVYADYKRFYVFLTKRGIAASDPDTWIPVSYGDILKVLEEAVRETDLKPGAAMILDNYIDVIRKISGGDDGIRKICGEVYSRHRAAFDLVFMHAAEEYKEGSPLTEEKRICDELYWGHKAEMEQINAARPRQKCDAVTEMIRQWADEMTLEGRIRTSLEARRDTYERFTTPVMSGILPDAEGCRSGWNTENFYFYEIRNSVTDSREHKVSMQLCVNLGNIPEELKRASDRMSRVKAPVHDSKAHRIYLETIPVIFRENDDREKVIKVLDGYLALIDTFERELTEGMGLN